MPISTINSHVTFKDIIIYKKLLPNMTKLVHLQNISTISKLNIFYKLELKKKLY